LALPRTVARPSVAARPQAWLPRARPSDGQLVFALALVGYLAVAVFLVFGANVLMGDAIARVAIAQRILFSHDPHLGAIGFVWGPLPTLSVLPLIPLKGLWPALVQQGFAGNILSALFMAGSVYQVHGFLKDLGVARPARLALTAVFALHPLVVFYGANAMSEAPFIFFLLIAARQLARWLSSRALAPQVYTGLALTAAYMTRYEAAAAGAAALAITAAASFSQQRGTPTDRARIASVDALVVGAPLLLTIIFWAGLSWLITGIPFEQASSVYGTTAQLRAKGLGTLGPAEALGWAGDGLRSILMLEPFLLLLVGLGVVGALRRRNLWTMAVPTVLGAVLVFMLWAYATGAILRSLRYFIVAVPLATVLGALLLPRGRQAARLAVIPIGMLALALPTGAAEMLSPTVNHFEAAPLQAAFNHGPLPEDQQRAALRFKTDREVARYVDALHAPRGSVLLDDFIGFAIVLGSQHPDQFVITSDRDFQAALADPAASGIQYVLVPPPDAPLSRLDAINRAYPTMYQSGAGIAQLVQLFQDVSDYGYDWRLYRIVSGP
jgi:hypothetical protein